MLLNYSTDLIYHFKYYTESCINPALFNWSDLTNVLGTTQSFIECDLNMAKVKACFYLSG